MGRTGDPLDDEFPPRIGGKKPSPRGAPCREEAGWPMVKMIVVVVVLLNVVITIRIIIVEPGGPRRVAQVVCLSVYGNMMSPVCKENE